MIQRPYGKASQVYAKSQTAETAGDCFAFKAPRDCEPAAYRLRLYGAQGVGTADAGVSLTYRFTVDDGFGEPPRVYDLTTDVGNAGAEHDLLIVEGLALECSVRLTVFSSSALTENRPVFGSAAIAWRA